MATRLSTPPPPSSTLHVPPTPKHGWDDKYEPYSPRKSTRVSRQRDRLVQTPPPQLSSSLRADRSSPPSTTKKVASNSMGSPPLTISKKRVAPSKDSRRVSGALNEDSMASAAAALGLPPKSEVKAESRSTSILRNNFMLPTPDKTPRKRTSEIGPGGLSSIARNLFPVRPESVDEVMPNPKKKGRKNYFTLDSYGAEEDSSIQIFTDSHERVPEVDNSADNPFYGAGAAVPEPTKRASKRRKITVPGEGEQTLEDVAGREDGLVYVFRGKKIFRKFSDLNEADSREIGQEDEGLDAELDATVPARLREGPLTRSSLKPRLLFPTADQVAAREKSLQVPDDDEEAVTDIEELPSDPATPSDAMEGIVATPKAPKFAPASPPTTVRATRSRKPGSYSPDSPNGYGVARGRANLSPFDGWSRKKSTVTSPSKKRGGETMAGDGSKRLRGADV